MMESLDKLIFTLREELQQYGEMIARLDDQQELVMRRAGHAVLESIPMIQAQSAVITQARELRCAAMKELCLKLKLAADDSFQALIPKLPVDYQPLVQALIQENNELLQKIHQRARQNHLLLSRTVESMQRVIHSLGVHQPSPVYTEDASVFRPAQPASIYEAVC